MTDSKYPAVITVKPEKAHLVRKLADDMKIKYREEVPEEGAIRFHFEADSREQANALALAVPREAYLYRGFFEGPGQPRNG